MGQHIENKKDKLYERLRSTQERYNAEYDKYLDEKRNFEEMMTETDDLYHSARQHWQKSRRKEMMSKKTSLLLRQTGIGLWVRL